MNYFGRPLVVGLVVLLGPTAGLPLKAQGQADSRLVPTKIEIDLVRASQLRGDPATFSRRAANRLPELRGREKGLLIGGLIGVGVGVLAIAAYEFSKEKPCNVGCGVVRILGSASVFAILGGVLGAAIEED